MGTKRIVLHWANVIYDKGITQTLKTNILNPFQEPRVSVFLFFSLISINYQLLWCCSFVSNCYLKIQFQCKDTFWEGNAFSSQYICLHWIRKKKLYLKNTPFLFYKNPFYKNHAAQNRILGFDLTAQGSLHEHHTLFMRFCVEKHKTPQRRMSLKINLLRYPDSQRRVKNESFSDSFQIRD